MMKKKTHRPNMSRQYLLEFLQIYPILLPGFARLVAVFVSTRLLNCMIISFCEKCLPVPTLQNIFGSFSASPSASLSSASSSSSKVTMSWVCLLFVRHFSRRENEVNRNLVIGQTNDTLNAWPSRYVVKLWFQFKCKLKLVCRKMFGPFAIFHK